MKLVAFTTPGDGQLGLRFELSRRRANDDQILFNIVSTRILKTALYLRRQHAYGIDHGGDLGGPSA